MKAIIFILGILFVTNGNAQKFDCASKTKTYQDFLKDKKWTESFDAWSEVRKNCPKENMAVYTDGIQILQYRIETAAAEDKEKKVRDLLKLYDEYHKNFPDSIPAFEVNKALVLIYGKIEAKDEIFTLLDNGFGKASKKVTSAKAIHSYFSMIAERFRAGDKKIPANVVLEKYSLLGSLLTQLETANPENKEYRTAHRSIDNMAKGLTTCDNLAEFYSKNLEANKENSDWLTNSLSSLSAKCSTNPIFLTLAEKLYAIKPTAQSANFMGLGNLKQRKFPEAVKFFEEAANLETQPSEKARTYYSLATGLLSGEPSKSKEYLNKALSFEPKFGKAYLFLAQLYANSANECGKTDFEKKAIIYLAIETNKKAAEAEPRLKPTADKTNKELASKSLTSAEISKEKKNGKSITIGCWINETITFPAK